MKSALTGVAAAILALSGSAWANPSPDGETLEWPPGAAADEPVQVVVSVPDQHLHVYVGGEKVAETNVSTGKRGHATPTGLFSILEKRRRHRSNIYSGAPMPHMQRLTWSGVALHGSGSVPSYPASHGCVRLPPSFAKKLFGLTERGGHVIVSASGWVEPYAIDHPNLFQPLPPAAEEGVGTKTAGNTGGPKRAPAVHDARAGIPVGTPLRRSLIAGEVQLEPEATLVEAAAEPAPLRDIDRKTDRKRVTKKARPADDRAPLRILVTRRTGRELVRDVQTLLRDLGYDPGKLDGWMGRNTGTAIAAFQESRGLDATGAMSDELVAELYDAAGRGTPPTGHIYVRRNFRQVFDAPVAIADPETPLGAHVFTVLDFDDGATEAQWLAMTLDDGLPEPDVADGAEADDTAAADDAGATDDADETDGAPAAVEVAASGPAPDPAAAALARIDLPEHLRKMLSRMLTPGTSLAISDDGISRETVERGSDFVVLTR